MAKNIRFKSNKKGFQALLLSTQVSNLCQQRAEAIANKANANAKAYYPDAEFEARQGDRPTKRARSFVTTASWEAMHANSKYNVLEKSMDAGRF